MEETPPRSRTKRAAIWLSTVAVSLTVGAGGATYVIVTHGDALGEPVMEFGARVKAASQPVVFETAETIMPLKGELTEPRPTPKQEARKTRGLEADAKVARR